MIGAIIGDIIGSRFEFDNCKSKTFELFDDRCTFTDDTVMTVAVAEALMSAAEDAASFKAELVRKIHELGNLYPYCGYGARFAAWLKEGRTEAYGSGRSQCR